MVLENFYGRRPDLAERQHRLIGYLKEMGALARERLGRFPRDRSSVKSRSAWRFEERAIAFAAVTSRSVAFAIQAQADTIDVDPVLKIETGERVSLRTVIQFDASSGNVHVPAAAATVLVTLYCF